jgi:hypothetical protein
MDKNKDPPNPLAGDKAWEAEMSAQIPASAINPISDIEAKKILFRNRWVRWQENFRRKYK